MNRFVAAVLALALSGCASFALRPAAASLAQGDNMGALPYMRSAPMLRELTQTGAGKIKHVVYVVQENRSFNDLFMGYPGATTAKNGKNSKGKTIALAPVSLATHLRDRARSQSDVRRMRRHGIAARNEMPHGRLRSRDFRRRPQKSAVRLRSAHGVETVLGYRARMGARRRYVPIAARRELRRASIRHRGAGKIERRYSRRALGMRGRRDR